MNLFFAWVLTHLPHIGITGLLITLWKVLRFFNRVTARFERSEATIADLANSHLPQIRTELAKSNQELAKSNVVQCDQQRELEGLNATLKQLLLVTIATKKETHSA